LDRGEPEQMVAAGVRSEGHGVQVESHPSSLDAVRLVITRHGG